MIRFAFAIVFAFFHVESSAAENCKYDSGRTQFIDGNGKVLTLIFETHMDGEAMEVFDRQMTVQKPLQLASVEGFISAHPRWEKIQKIEQDLRVALTRRSKPIEWIAAESAEKSPFPLERLEAFTRFMENAKIPADKAEIARTIYFGADASAWYAVEKERQSRKVGARPAVAAFGVDTGRDPQVEKLVQERESAFAEYAKYRDGSGDIGKRIEAMDKLDRLTKESNAAMIAELPRRDLTMAQNLLKEMSERSGPGFALLGFEHGRGVVANLEKLCKQAKSAPPKRPAGRN